ncbi:hypothetical protein J6590_055939 [Homalodisca vitripennis]|nr:hypothetical protein J6590_055939 [Homalodisca vitripennis]
MLLSPGIYVLRKLSEYCPTQVLMMAYYGLIYPHLSYGSECETIRGSDIHPYATRGRDDYGSVRHRTLAHELLPSQAGVRLVNKLPSSIKSAPTLKAFKTRLKTTLTTLRILQYGRVHGTQLGGITIGLLTGESVEQFE